MMNLFYALPYSPWSEKARFALDHNLIPYREIEYVPMIMTPFLRLTAKKFTGKITVPMLLSHSQQVLQGSLAISDLSFAVHYEQNPQDKILAHKWDKVSEEILLHLRPLIIDSVLNDRELQKATLPSYLPEWSREPLRPISILGAQFLKNKYKNMVKPELRNKRISHVSHLLMKFREELGNKDFLGEHFTYADITMATSLFYISPPKELQLHPALMKKMIIPELQTQFIDLISWRNKLYQKNRKLKKNTSLIPH